MEIRHYVMIALLLEAGFTGGLTTFSYLESRENLLQNEKAVEDLTEENIIQPLSLSDRGLWLFDETLNYRMMDGFDLFLAEYARSSGDPYRMDPYIIDENGVIIRSTEESEIGLDFREYPRFYSFLTGILKLVERFSRPLM